MGFQSAGSNTYQVENIPVLADQWAIRFFRHFLRRFMVQAVVDIIGQPGAAESIMGLQPPHGKFPYIQLDILKREQQTDKILILEYAHMGKGGSP